MDGRTDRRTDERTDSRTNGPTDGQTNGRTGGRTEGWTDRWMGERINMRLVLLSPLMSIREILKVNLASQPEHFLPFHFNQEIRRTTKATTASDPAFTLALPLAVTLSV